MSLSDKQLEELHKDTITNRRDIKWIRERLEAGGDTMDDLYGKINRIEREQLLLKGKIGAFVLFLTLCATMAIQGIGWLLSYLFKFKGGS